MKTTGNKDFDKALTRLRGRLRKLATTTAEEPAGRRRARREALSALNLLRAAMDRQFPAIIVKRKVVRLKTFDGRAARLTRAGWVHINENWARDYAAAGITIKRVQGLDGRKRPVLVHGFYVPGWAWAIGGSDPYAHRTRLREAKRSRLEQRAALASHVMAAST